MIFSQASRATLAFGLMLAGASFTTPAFADVAAARATLESWTKINEPAINTETGEEVPQPTVVQRMLLNDENQQVASVGVQISEDGEEKKLIIEVPVGVRLDSGLAIQIDQDNPVTLPYRVCFPLGCFAEITIADDFVNKLKAGSMLAVLVRPFHSSEVIGLPFSLAGFTAAYDGEAGGIDKIIEAQEVIGREIEAAQNQSVEGLAERRRQEIQERQQQQGGQPSQ